MNNRERTMAILNYENYDRLSVVHFGFWDKLLIKWVEEGHLKPVEIEGVADGNVKEKAIGEKLGFDYNWYNAFHPRSGLGSLLPSFENEVIEELPNGMKKIINEDGAIVLIKDGVNSIPSEVDHLLKDREGWEKHYLPKLQFSEDRIDWEALDRVGKKEKRDEPYGIFCGSLFGQIRNWMGVEGISYLYVDDEDLYDEIINTVGDLSFKTTEAILKRNSEFDFGHFWEDICFKNGPLVSPKVFEEKVGWHYRRITELLNSYGIEIVSLDCDGMIDALIPTWFYNGVNTMFPIEVGTWNASIKPWREEYGRELRGVGGMNKHVFAEDYKAIDDEIERLKPLVELGGFIPCPDHRIPPTAKWENIQYYCDRIKKVFG